MAENDVDNNDVSINVDDMTTREYLNTFIMPSLLPAVEALLKEAGICHIFHLLVCFSFFKI
jgi:hypothetical protein